MERIKDVVVHSWLRWMIFSLAPVVSNVESWGILRRNALRTRKQPQIPRLSSVAWFTSILAMSILETGFGLIVAVTILVQVLFEGNCTGFSQDDSAGVSRGDSAGVSRDDCAGVSRNDSRTCDSRNESRADDDSRNEPTMYFDSRNGRCAEVDFQQDDETFLDVRKDDVTFLDVQTDGVTLPVPCSSSSFSLGSVVVVGPRENVCSDMKFESDGGTDDSKPEPLAKSAEMKRLVGIAVASGTPIRVAYKDVRKAYANRGSSTEGTG